MFSDYKKDFSNNNILNGKTSFCAITNVNYSLTDSEFKTITINNMLQIFMSLGEHVSPGNIRLIDLI
jgi:hypothetical protein